MKFSGKIGFWDEDIEEKPGVYVPKILERKYIGDIKRDVRRFQTVTDQQNSNLVLNNRLSIIADMYLQKKWMSIKYVLWNDVKWEVNSVDISSYPRVILELGGVYNGNEAFT